MKACEIFYKIAKSKTIKFPKKERASLKKRLDDGKSIYTIRVSKEQGNYEKNDIVSSSFGKLEVISIKTINNIHDYKYFDELTKKQVEELSRYEKMDVMELRRFK